MVLLHNSLLLAVNCSDGTFNLVLGVVGCKMACQHKSHVSAWLPVSMWVFLMRLDRLACTGRAISTHSFAALACCLLEARWWLAKVSEWAGMPCHARAHQMRN